MAKKIKLPLDMGNDVKVRTIEELKEHYNTEKVVSYFLDGQLLTWLEERFYEDEAGKIKGISKDSPNISAEIAEAFGIEIQDEVDVEEIEERNERLNLLRQFTSDDEILKKLIWLLFPRRIWTLCIRLISFIFAATASVFLTALRVKPISA